MSLLGSLVFNPISSIFTKFVLNSSVAHNRPLLYAKENNLQRQKQSFYRFFYPRLHFFSFTNMSSYPLQPLDSKKLEIYLNTNPSTLPPLDKLRFGHSFTDHMLEVDWDIIYGWSTPQIKPFSNISLHPASSSLHYGLEVFEGLKAFRLVDSSVALFRPEMNVDRLLKSCERMCLPSFDKTEMLKLFVKLVELESRFVPHLDGYALYLRPLIIATEPTLGVGPPGKAKLLIICSPVGPYFPEGFKAIKLLADSKFVRAWPGGVGESKTGGNYGPTIMPQVTAEKCGCSQILWLFPNDEEDFYITEAGAMNVFIYWKNHDGIDELTTFPLADNLVLPGITRDSLIEIAKGIEGIKMSERRLRIKSDLLKALSEGRVYEVFGTGTACAVAPIGAIHFEGQDYNIPLGKNNCGKKNGIGALSEKLLTKLRDIQVGQSAALDYDLE